MGPSLAVMLQEAGYDLHSQYESLLFHYRYVIARLGVRPTADGLPSNWKSFMTDDFSPVEFSWSWDNAERPMIRYSIEAIGSAAGTAVDPFNQEMTKELVHQLSLAVPAVDWKWYDQLSRAFGIFDESINEDDSLKSKTGSTSVFLAFEMRSEGVLVKAYFFPLKCLKTNISRLDIFSDGIKSMESQQTKFPAYDQLVEFIANNPEGSRLTMLAAAIDCVHPSKSRLKIYVRSPSTSFRSVRTVMTLGGKLNNRRSESALEELLELWRLTLRFEDQFSLDDELPSTTHETSGILYNFDVKPGNEIPEPKVYIPVKHYGLNDMAVAEGVATFLKKRGRDSFNDNYQRMLKAVCSHRSLDSQCGLQTYIACTLKQDGTLSLTCYFGPEVYHPARWLKSALAIAPHTPHER